MKVFDPRRAGQVVPIVAFVILAIAVLFLLNVDFFLAARAKMRAQNAGDAAALAAARGQAEALNRIGRLNLARIDAICRAGSIEGAATENDALLLEQARLAFAGPVMALDAAHRAAAANHSQPNPDWNELLRVRADFILRAFAEDDERLPFPGANVFYAQLLKSVAAAPDGLAAAPDNADYFDFNGGHLLYLRDFYEAVLGENWCWFKFHAQSLLDGYRSWSDWSQSGPLEPERFENSEIFGLGVSREVHPLATVATTEEIVALAADFGFGNVNAKVLEESGAMTRALPWYFYDRGIWGPWTRIDPHDTTDGPPFPATGTVKARYDYDGASAVVRVQRAFERLAPATGALASTNVWTAAAKPFGAVLDDNGAFLHGRLILPVFTDVRLIPVDAAGGGTDTSDCAWAVHLRDHLGRYLSTGPGNAECRWCQALEKWEDREFRQAGQLWLKLYGHTCARPGGNGRRGGTRRGH